jgi:PAS domain S-box-containing protein
MLDPFVIHRAVRDGRGAIADFVRVYANPALIRLNDERGLGNEAGSLDIHPSGPGYALFAGCCQVVETGVPMLLDEFDLERPFDGNDVERIFDLRITRHADGVAITGRDISRYILAEREATARNTRLIAAIEQTAESVVIADPNAAIVYVNPAFEEITGYTRSEVIGQNPRILQSGIQGHEFYERMWQTLRAGETWRGELVNRRKDGSTFIEDASITPVFDRFGRLSSYVAVKRDVTQIRHIETTLSATIRQQASVLNSCPGSRPRRRPKPPRS